eukprot:418480-Pyramimonas_sp.AAC.1
MITLVFTRQSGVIPMSIDKAEHMAQKTYLTNPKLAGWLIYPPLSVQSTALTSSPPHLLLYVRNGWTGSPR